MFWLLAGLSIILASLAAYTLAMQETTLILGRLLVNKPHNESGTGVQDAITPQAQNTRNIMLFVLIVLVFSLTTYYYAWYHGLWVVLASFACSSLIKLLFGLQPGSPLLVAAVSKDLKRRRNSFLNNNDALRAEAIEMLIDKLEQITTEQIQKEKEK